jgi:hypothetical protein
MFLARIGSRGMHYSQMLWLGRKRDGAKQHVGEIASFQDGKYESDLSSGMCCVVWENSSQPPVLVKNTVRNTGSE